MTGSSAVFRDYSDDALHENFSRGMIIVSPAADAAAVAAHYDDLDELYRSVWGNHIHHGCWITA